MPSCTIDQLILRTQHQIAQTLKNEKCVNCGVNCGAPTCAKCRTFAREKWVPRRDNGWRARIEAYYTPKSYEGGMTTSEYFKEEKQNW